VKEEKMSRDESAKSARNDATRERLNKLLKSIVEVTGYDKAKAFEAFAEAVKDDKLAKDYMIDYFLDDVERDRPDLKDDPHAIVAEALRRLKALSMQPE
jgi:hypothetical protein